VGRAPASDGRPLEENWIVRKDAEQFARLIAYRDDHQPRARRNDQGGRTSFEPTPMAIAALEQILQWRLERITASLAAVITRIDDRLTGLNLDRLTRQHGLGLPLPADAEHVAQTLASRGVHAALRGAALGISPAPAHYRPRR
jgi:hypothetical protein